MAALPSWTTTLPSRTITGPSQITTPPSRTDDYAASPDNHAAISDNHVAFTDGRSRRLPGGIRRPAMLFSQATTPSSATFADDHTAHRPTAMPSWMTTSTKSITFPDDRGTLQLSLRERQRWPLLLSSQMTVFRSVNYPGNHAVHQHCLPG
ncbi:hypothetical protein GWK47_031551 [Chionoecetes opilio]|uniref:Uncharacterized protein n=1 Tax=Chionoecetes opilio TaxID=41210 RepID=A0A8J4YKZ7_CHIOP|nr:hypothetical protein GWK47_031551 [Chionoecetes opilio]